MVKTNKIIKKMIIFNTIILLILYLISYWWVNIIVKKANKFILENYAAEIVNIGENILNGLGNSVDNIAKNKYLQDILKKDYLNSIEVSRLQEEIKIVESALSVAKLTDYISIYDFSSKTLYTADIFQENYNVYEMVWFDELLRKYNEDKNTIGLVYEEETRNEKVVIANFIEVNKELVGIVMINMYLDDFLDFMEDIYVKGDLDILIRIDDDNFYSKDLGIIDSDKLNELKGFKIQDESFIFMFDENMNMFSSLILDVNILHTIILVVIITLSTIMFKYMKTVIFKPLVNHIDKFKNVLKLLNKYDEDIDEKDDEEQLEILLNSLNKSIDENLRRQVYYDDLTNLLNRKGLKREFINLKNKGKRFAVIFIDINKFKEINDTYGHLAGDKFLKEFSEILSRCLEGKGILTRLAGDEFIVLYENYESEDELLEFYKTVLKTFEKVRVADGLLEVNFSAGVAIYPDDGESFEELIRKSDHMMYSDKNNSNDNIKIRFFDDKVYNELNRVDLIKSEIRYALCKGELSLVYQPILDRDKQIKKVEALLRWRNNKLGEVSPEEFIRYLEEDRLIIPVGYWCIEVICKDYLRLIENDDEYKDINISINVSPLQLMEKNFFLNFKKILDKYKLCYSNISIEITESILMEDNDNILKNLSNIDKLGVIISLDDFGTGYTSFAYLRKFKFKCLKIDKVLLNKADKRGYEIISSIIDIAHKLEMKVIMEGVESDEQFNRLIKIGCDFFQGYYLGKFIELDNLKK
ncbi:putative bifunctional diguanylate cyclase/phosphodiesterase [Clostridium sp. B9]|uniref:putative bifunctional diguanylate cyclase/phosphodiesterase n=1 Tax=Clostridium sp. B9 TaxID=3423224 RepID=UPI003D2EAF2F